MKPSLVFAMIMGLVITSLFSLSAQESKSQWDGVYTTEQAARGEVFYRASCQSCHADDLTGFAMEYSEPPPPALIGNTFSGGWNGFTLGEMFETITYTMPADDPGSMDPQESVDILAFILQSAEYPAGEVELAADAEALRVYEFLSVNPAASD
jgi:mono/diheme cytochrome c family protein